MFFASYGKTANFLHQLKLPVAVRLGGVKQMLMRGSSKKKKPIYVLRNSQ
ncbi:Uncharacterised protein [Serratia fonticola]|nr:Uncharacterised protein [Serratia fonticola]